MKLNIQEAEQFYRIWWSLLGYVNKKFDIAREFDAQVESEMVRPSTIVPICEKLWSDNTLLEYFVSENPARLPDEDLGIASSWKHRIEGSFFVYKYLVKHTIFIDDKTPSRAYGVYGIVSPIEDVIEPPLPVLVKTVLLPFKDKIIYDGIMNRYNMLFGGGYRSNLDFAYRNAKERNGIITSFIPQNDAEQLQKSLLERNNLILKAFSKHLAKSGLSTKMVQQHTANIESFANKYLMNFDPPRLLIDISSIHIMEYLNQVLIDSKVKTTNVVSFKRFIRFLSETGRIQPDDYWAIHDLLKGYRE